jgi:hypothetical protein
LFPFVKRVLSHELMGKGAGHIVYRIAKENGLSVRDAGLKLADGELWEQVDSCSVELAYATTSRDVLDDNWLNHPKFRVYLTFYLENGLSVRDAGLKLADGELWEQVDRIFKEAN